LPESDHFRFLILDCGFANRVWGAAGPISRETIISNSAIDLEQTQRPNIRNERSALFVSTTCFAERTATATVAFRFGENPRLEGFFVPYI
jgi:hypothetical protein